MENLRMLIQSALTIEGIETSVLIPDDMIEDGKTYFEYSLSESYIDRDWDKNSSMQVNLIGYLVRRDNSVENTLSILDNALELVKQALKSINFTYRYSDVSLDKNIRKIQVTGTVKYNEINYWLV